MAAHHAARRARGVNAYTQEGWERRRGAATIVPSPTTPAARRIPASPARRVRPSDHREPDRPGRARPHGSWPDPLAATRPRARPPRPGTDRPPRPGPCPAVAPGVEQDAWPMLSSPRSSPATGSTAASAAAAWASSTAPPTCRSTAPSRSRCSTTSSRRIPTSAADSSPSPSSPRRWITPTSSRSTRRASATACPTSRCGSCRRGPARGPADGGAARARPRRAASSPSSPPRWTPRTRPASCTATSSPPTCSSRRATTCT